jgi:hypothetical protein
LTIKYEQIVSFADTRQSMVGRLSTVEVGASDLRQFTRYKTSGIFQSFLGSVKGTIAGIK